MFIDQRLSTGTQNFVVVTLLQEREREREYCETCILSKKMYESRLATRKIKRGEERKRERERRKIRALKKSKSALHILALNIIETS